MFAFSEVNVLRQKRVCFHLRLRSASVSAKDSFSLTSSWLTSNWQLPESGRFAAFGFRNRGRVFSWSRRRWARFWYQLNDIRDCSRGGGMSSWNVCQRVGRPAAPLKKTFWYGGGRKANDSRGGRGRWIMGRLGVVVGVFTPSSSWQLSECAAFLPFNSSACRGTIKKKLAPATAMMMEYWWLPPHWFVLELLFFILLDRMKTSANWNFYYREIIHDEECRVSSSLQSSSTMTEALEKRSFSRLEVVDQKLQIYSLDI